MMKVIKSTGEYRANASDLETLIDAAPDPGTPEHDRLELLALILEDYEKRHFAIESPDPIDAIVFRMEQKGMSQRDLVPLIGSRSKVSEVLARRRPLSLSMMRAIHTHLDIPADVLLQGAPADVLAGEQVDPSRYPVSEMKRRRWLDPQVVRTDVERALRSFLQPFGQHTAVQALYRSSAHVRSGRKMHQEALMAWTVRVLTRGSALKLPKPFAHERLSASVLRQIAGLSLAEFGPRLAVERLADYGIAVIVERHLPRTYIDGALVWVNSERPIIALTLRYDRVDNFWYSLFHELAHLVLHINPAAADSFFDDLELDHALDQVEEQADEAARDWLVPRDVWIDSPARVLRSSEAAISLANAAHVHPAIAAGLMRYHHRNYRILNSLVGSGEVRHLFPESGWK